MIDTRTIFRTVGGLALAAVVSLAGACGSGAPELDTRTYQLEHLEPARVGSLLRPYIYADRESTPGRISIAQGAVTVRETPDNLAKIERVLSEYDVPAPYIRLRFQLIRADGAGASDPAIADVEAQLRELFQFEGYELMGEAVVTARDRSEVSQEIAGPDERYGVRSSVGFQRPGTIRLEEVRLFTPDGSGFETSVNLRPGQTVVLGTSRVAGSGQALILTVRAELLDRS